MQMLIDAPVVVQQNFKDILEVALTRPTIQEALTYACICESERAIAQARFNLGSGSNGAGWDTCFGYVINEVMSAYTNGGTNENA